MAAAAARAAPGPGTGGPGRWEVVRKGRRGPAGGAGSRRALGEANAGRALPVPAPIAASSTIFQLGFERALRKQNKEQVPPAAAAEPPPRRQHTGKSGRKAPGSDGAAQPGRCRSLEEAVKALDLAELQKELQKSQSVFPENPSVWVKDLAGYLNYKLQAPRSDPVLSQHPHDYPYCLASRELRGIIRSLLAKASGSLELFFDHCIYTMLQELDKAQGESLHGYRICIQALLLYRPRIATSSLGKYLEVLRSQQSRPAKCLTVLWALGQAGFTDLHEGLRVWLGVMLPVLGIKSLSPYAVSYLDRLLMMHPNLTKGFGMIGPKDFFPLLDFAFMPNNSLSPSLQEQLRRLYPRLKVLALGARPEAALHTFFPSFLSRATPACPPAMKEELLTSLSQCLSLDPLSFSVWRQLYTKHLAQSSLLLNHLLETWESSSKKVQQSLQETVRSFKVTNEELAARAAGGDTDVAACDAACKELLCKMRGRGLPWPRLLLVLLLLAAGFLLHDVHTHGSFQASSCARLLRSSGVLPAWQKVSRACLQGYRWLERGVARHGSVALAALWPQLERLGGTGAEVARAVSQQGCSLLAWLHGSLPWLGDWLRSRLPEALLHLAECVRELLQFLLHSCLLPLLQGLAAGLQQGWQRCLDSCSGEVTWQCVRDHLTSFTSSCWVFLRNAALALKDWALAAISGR
ncbi:transmembrane protein 214 [Motacilla alba alba]|uniref:transmembrane protein 214 n=1 Tax=Motacilla alba alba TaxID=1094192 RepID=UPI0018D56E51|nr:transmembrane protein 214 [Motacilla alba alba]